jgi:secreted trypsin-like serine protease
MIKKCHAAAPRLFEKKVGEHRIVNGTNAPQGKYPSVVSLMHNGVHTCGGTILNEKWLLSAASCIEEFVQLFCFSTLATQNVHLNQ